MTREAAVLAVAGALMLGYYWARWRRAEATNKTAKAAVDAAGRQAWRARGAIVIIGFIIIALIDLWFRGRGR